jgi:hypothetical protein
MASERSVRRYSAYFRGWATTFGSHDKADDRERGLVWLFGDQQLGLILTPRVKRFLYPLFLGRCRPEAPDVELRDGLLRIQAAKLPFDERDRRAFQAVMDLAGGGGDLHLFQTYHLVYPTGTRILTLSRRQPLALVYREIPPLRVRLL